MSCYAQLLIFSDFIMAVVQKFVNRIVATVMMANNDLCRVTDLIPIMYIIHFNSFS